VGAVESEAYLMIFAVISIALVAWCGRLLFDVTSTVILITSSSDAIVWGAEIQWCSQYRRWCGLCRLELAIAESVIAEALFPLRGRCCTTRLLLGGGNESVCDFVVRSSAFA
jgi:hypothetical protein